MDSVGKLKSRGKSKGVYINDVQKRVLKEYRIVIRDKIFSGYDLPQAADFLDACTRDCDLNLLIFMSNYVADSLEQPDISDGMVQACRRLQKVAERVPTHVIYGGPGEMWRDVVNRDVAKRFDTKTQQIRELLAKSGLIKVSSGA